MDDLTSPAKYIVGIGASAGGLEAIEAFFKKMPVNSGLAFVVVQHLSPDYKSLMVELLSKHTEMPVNRIENGMLVKENNIYLLPPRKNLSSFHGRLLLKEQDRSEGLNLPIDIFFRSLAEDIGEYAISIILSGTGSDGTRGIRAIKERGGMVMVQDDETAKFDGMPKNAIATGLVDFILSPEEMPKQLLSFIKHPYAYTPTPEAVTLPGEDSDLTRIFLMLREKTKVDFTYYKPTTVLRRIERRVTINQLQDLTEYVRFLESNTTEVSTLFQELLIGVTCFFRDELAFDELRDKWLDGIIENLQDDEIRLWVTACSTGEEAYTFAMLLSEYRERHGEYFRIKIFATDIDHKAVEKASNGIYPASITADVPHELLSKYFIRREDNYQVSQKIRELVVFAQHNLIKDPPFTNINLLSCRNVLIYLQPILQRKILELFNFSLRKEGILMLGTSESIGEMVDYFDLVSPKWKLYRSRGKHNKGIGLSISDPTQFLKGPFHNTPSASNNRNLAYHAEDRVLDRFVRGLAKDMLPFTLIVNEHMEVTHVFGDAKDYMEYPSGKLVQDVTKIVKKDLSIPIATGITRALSNNDDIVLSNIRIRDDQDVRLLNLRIKCLTGKKGEQPLLAIFISETIKKDVLSESDSLTFDVNQEAEQRISDLEHELQFTRENLQATVEELETSNEELQATNEELLASNEELQSTNEELQSVNEELYTVNAEYQGKITELTLLNNDLDNLFNSTHIATLFLDENLDIRRFTPKLQAIFHIMDQDIGRPYRHLSHRITGINLVEQIDAVMMNHKPILKDVQIETGNWYLLRITPYNVADNVYAGVILTFVDIDQLKKAQQELQQREQEETQRLATVVRYSHDAISLQTLDGEIVTWNRGAEELYGWSESEALRMNFSKLLPETEISPDALIRAKLKTGSSVPAFEAKRIAKNGSLFKVWVTVSVFYTENHHRELLAFTERDISSRQQVENKDCIACMQHLTSIVMDTHDAIILLDPFGNITAWNQGAEKIYGWQQQEVINTNIIDLVPAEEQQITRDRIDALVNGKVSQHNIKARRLTKEGHEITVRLFAAALSNHNGEVLLIVLTERHF